MRRMLVAGFVGVASIGHAEMPKLMPGGKAPALNVGGWLKGTPQGPKAKLTVVEFWATWCGPCKENIPHLTELAKKFKGKVDVVGVSVWEQPSTKVDDLKKFVAEMGPKMDYRVAYDTPSQAMVKTWLEPSGQRGIPTSFLLNDAGKILWIGYPTELDRNIREVLAGKFDIAKSKATFLAYARDFEEAQELHNRVEDAAKEYRAGNKEQAERTWDEAAAHSRQGSEMALQTRLDTYPVSSPEGKALIAKLLGGSGNDQMMLAMKASELAKTDPEAARSLADQVVAKTSDCIALYDAAITFSTLGDYSDAISAAESALKKMESDARKDQLVLHGFKTAVLKVRDEATEKQKSILLPQVNTEINWAKSFDPGEQEKVTVDEATKAKLEKLLETYKKVALDNYPLVIRALHMEKAPGIEKFDISLTYAYKDVAATAKSESGCIILVSADYALAHPEDFGMIVHELTHVVQSYPSIDNLWLIEGIADWVRWFNFEDVAKRPKPGYAVANAKTGYQVTAAFLDWASSRYNPSLVPLLNQALKKNEYREEIFKGLTGHTLDELNEEWRSSLKPQ